MYIPVATYRVQLHKGFNFSQLTDLLPYLHELGISTVYASPVTRASAGSAHGYDVINPLEINPEIGTAEQWKSITRFLKDHNMGWVQDIVPNHMAYSTDNELVHDLLERGKDSDYFGYFDIIPQYPATADPQYSPYKKQCFSPPTKIMVPFLEKELPACIRNGEIKLAFGSSGFYFRYADQRYPASISSYHWICAAFPGFFQPLLTWSDKLASFSRLPLEEWIYFKALLMAEIYENPQLKTVAEEYCVRINLDPPVLAELLSFQHYELCGWKTSFTKMNYRRFFAVNSLICLRMEDHYVFTWWHQLLLNLARQGLIQGFRVDHIDGLFDPGGYLKKLREQAGPDTYLISEKILQENEETLPGWPVQGTTGYDFLSFVNQLLTDKEGKEKLVSYFYSNILPEQYQDMVFNKKLAFLKSHLTGELNNLMRWLTPIMLSKGNPAAHIAVKEALAVLMAAFPVYRVYATEFPLSETDLHWIKIAFDKAYAKVPAMHETLDWLKSLFRTDPEDVLANQILYFIQRWSQYTAPLAAKGTEDTVFYNYNVLIGLNEVGDSPGRSPITATDFHSLMQRRQETAPLTLNASSTHDTKRGEDNRLRINLISMYAAEWIGLVEKWKALNQPFIKMQNGRRSPSANDEYLIYQALTGVFPADAEAGPEFQKRFFAYLTKAMREENQETQWEEPDSPYEKNTLDFVAAILSPEHAFLSAFLPFIKKIISAAEDYALCQTLLKLTAPGIPDIYQGAELWDLSLVDPDNRSPVDFDRRKNMLDGIVSREKECEDTVLTYTSLHRSSGAQKLFLIRKILHLRRNYPDLFIRGQYIPLTGTPELLAYVRKHADQQLLVVVPLPSGNDTAPSCGIPDIGGTWKNLFTNEIIQLTDTLDPKVLLKDFPVAALFLQNVTAR